jgi:predicted nucleic acid-binding Zn ribbon protein
LREWRPFNAAVDPSALQAAASLNKLIPGVMKRLGLEQRLQESQIFSRWSEIVGEVNGRICQPVSLRNGRLIVGVVHSAWIQELRPIKTQMLQKIQQRVGKKHVCDIIFRNAG